MFRAITQHLLTNRRHPINQPNVRSTTHRFLSNTKPLVCSGRNTTWTIQRHRSITHLTHFSPSKPPSVQMVCNRDTPLPICLTCLNTCLAPSRSGTLAAVTKTRNTNPKVSTVINRLRPLIFLFAIIAHCLVYHCCTLDTLTIDDGVSVGLRCRSCSILVHSRRRS